MKSKIILGLATLVGLALPAVAQDTYCHLDRDGDRQICTTRSYDRYGNVYERRYSAPVYNGFYGNRSYYNGYDRDARRWREHEDHERREHAEHEWREHHRDYDGYDR